MITKDHKLWGQNTPPTNIEKKFFWHSLTVVKIMSLERSLNITRLMQTTLSHTNVPFKIIMYAVAMVIIKQTICIATTNIMWEMWILPEKEAF